MGQISIYSLPALRRQILFSCIKASDINALSTIQFTPYAHAFYLQSSSELTEVTFTPQIVLSYSMKISYDKIQRKTIQRSTMKQISVERNEPSNNVDEKHQKILPKSPSVEVNDRILL
jgi:hypothetical protein